MISLFFFPLLKPALIFISDGRENMMCWVSLHCSITFDVMKSDLMELKEHEQLVQCMSINNGIKEYYGAYKVTTDLYSHFKNVTINVCRVFSKL